MKRTSRQLAIIFLAIVSILFLIPILWLAVTALKRPEEVSALPISWLPSHPQWGNFVAAFTRINFLGYARNSLIIATLTAVLSTGASAFIGFGFARLRARGSKIAFAVVIGTMMLPPIITLIPTYLLFARANLLNTYVPWILWGLGGSAYLIFLFRQAFRGIPIEIEDAAILDGCGYLQIWWRVYLPLSRATVAASLLLSFVAAWGDFLTPKLLLRSDTTTLAVAITTGYYDPQGHTINTLLAAGALMFAVPVIIVFLVLQRHFVHGLATTGMK